MPYLYEKIIQEKIFDCNITRRMDDLRGLRVVLLRMTDQRIHETRRNLREHGRRRRQHMNCILGVRPTPPVRPHAIGDVVWCTLAGHPTWPAYIHNIEGTRALVVWFNSGETSWVTPRQIHAFYH